MSKYVFLWPKHSPSLTKWTHFSKTAYQKRSDLRQTRNETHLHRYAYDRSKTTKHTGSVLMWIEMPHMQYLICICAWSKVLLALANTFPRLERTKSSYGNRVTTFYNLFSFSSFFREFFFLRLSLFALYLSFLFSISISLFFSFYPSPSLSLCLYLPNCKSSIVISIAPKFRNSGEWILNRCSALQSAFFSFFFSRLIRWWFYFVFIRWMSY